MTSMPEKRTDAGLFLAILTIVVLVLAGLVYAASQAPTSDPETAPALTDERETSRPGPPATSSEAPAPCTRL